MQNANQDDTRYGCVSVEWSDSAAGGCWKQKIRVTEVQFATENVCQS